MRIIKRTIYLNDNILLETIAFIIEEKKSKHAFNLRRSIHKL